MLKNRDFEPATSLCSRRTLLKGFGFLGVTALGGSLVGCRHQKLISDLVGGVGQSPMIEVGGPQNELAFFPDRLQIRLGDSVIWKLQSGGHTVTAYHPSTFNLYQTRIPEGAEPWEFDLLAAPKDTLSTWTPKEEGVYNYFCRPHESVGMVGVIVVGKPLAGPGLSAPQQEIPSLARKKLEELVAWAKTLR